MTYEQVVAIVGCEGTLGLENMFGGKPLDMRLWTGNGDDGRYSVLQVQLWDGNVRAVGESNLK
jgi:hypothetical protein